MANETARVLCGSRVEDVDPAADLSLALERAIAASRAQGAGAVLELGDGEYVAARAVSGSPHGLTIRGRGKDRTRLRFTARSPAKVRVPAVGSSSSALEEVETEALGLYVHPDGLVDPSLLALEDLSIVVSEGTPASASREWSVVHLHGSVVRVRSVRVEANRSSDAGSSVLYKSQKSRSVLWMAAIAVGESKWVEPHPELALPVQNVDVDGLEGIGEPLEASGEARTDGRVVALHVRKVAGGTLRNVTLGSASADAVDTEMDLVFTGVPANNDTTLVSFYDPWRRRVVTRTYTWKSASPSGSYEILIAASAALSARALETAILANEKNASGSGTDLVTAGVPMVAFGSATAAACRVKTKPWKDAAGRSAPANKPFGVNVAVGTGSYGSVRVVSLSSRRLLYHWLYGVYVEDSPMIVIDESNVGGSICAKSQIALVNGHKNFVGDTTPAQDILSENGHNAVDNVLGDYCGYTSGLVCIRGAGFTSVGPGMRTGQNGIIFTHDASAAVVDADEGIHKGFTVTVAAGNVANNDKVTITDSKNQARAFTWKTTPSDSYDVAVGANAEESLANLHEKILSKMRVKELYAFTEYPTPLGGGTFQMEGTFFDWGHVYATTPAIAENVDAGATITVALDNRPAQNTHGRYDVNSHWPVSSDACSAPFVKLKKFTGKVRVSGFMHNVDHLIFNSIAQEVWSATFTATPEVGDSVNVRPTAAGTRLNFIFNAGADSSPNFFCGAASSAEDACKKLVTKMLAVEAATPGSVGAFALFVGGLGINAVTITKAVIEDDASFVTETDAGNNAITLTRNIASPAANASKQRRNAMVVIEDCREFEIDGVSAAPIPFTQWVSGTLIEAYAPNGIPAASAGDQAVIQIAYAGYPKIPISVTRSWSLPMSGRITNCDFMGPFGANRQSTAKLVDFSGSVSASDVVFSNNRVNGAAV